MKFQECNLNIRYDPPKEILAKRERVYSKMPGWLGFGKKDMGYEGIPYWFSYNKDEKYIIASVESSGLHFEGNIDDYEWLLWKTNFKKISTEILRFKVGEIEEGEVRHEIEWIY
ncbi:hypothetical protein [uncultured Aquimarina sp.]|uniref:hypothetical protein n=1 Tax=uncultured Aquimarina sp. TaxID=575652 RepID=UPI00261E2B88|nr:hypothetical protein [uncultured Aquimarina sp.]